MITHFLVWVFILLHFLYHLRLNALRFVLSAAYLHANNAPKGAEWAKKRVRLSGANPEGHLLKTVIKCDRQRAWRFSVRTHIDVPFPFPIPSTSTSTSLSQTPTQSHVAQSSPRQNLQSQSQFELHFGQSRAVPRGFARVLSASNSPCHICIWIRTCVRATSAFPSTFRAASDPPVASTVQWTLVHVCPKNQH